MHAAQPMIRFENVSRRYGSRRRGVLALRDVALDIERGSACAVVGPNGAGKSTLFALTLGFLRPTDGAVAIDGRTPREYVRDSGAGYLPERFGPPSAWRVLDMLRALARLEGASPAAADEALARWGLESHAEREVGQLSHGLRQRLGLAQALLVPRALVVLDEPHEGLDPLWRVRLREAVLALREAGTTVLVASHDLVEVERMAAQVVLLDAGRVRRTFATETAPTPTRYRVRLAAASDGFSGAFETGAGAPDGELTGGVVHEVEVRDADELSRRLAAAIADGARVVAVEPRHEPLEERVRRELTGEEA